MSKKHYGNKQTNLSSTLDPISPNYNEKIKNKENVDTPYQESRSTKHI